MSTGAGRKYASIDLEEAIRFFLDSGTGHGLDGIINAGTPLVRHFARIYAGGRHEEDFIQVGYEGLIKAAKRYKPEMGTAFSTYAGHCIIGEIRHYIRKETSFYKPGYLARLQGRVDEIIEKSLGEKGEVPEKSYIANELNIREEGLDQAMRAGLVSLDEIDITRICSIRYESFQLPIEDRIVLAQAFEKLGLLKQKVIYLLFFRNMTQQQVADKLGMNQRKVSRLMHVSLEDMRRTMDEKAIS